ncbi:hypothetical protein B0F90DRAFT_1824173 [Multifurca ochricompacta]|uniref:Transmembrane protein n=1 Tax=Multifurca ochricompacta TaxID=376703 RepID=A0AAD4LX63_9AGAM|nr:hypothetical protein B0F90DRAFT_1824173 [Multifurca ochricompacta]
MDGSFEITLSSLPAIYVSVLGQRPQVMDTDMVRTTYKIPLERAYPNFHQSSLIDYFPLSIYLLLAQSNLTLSFLTTHSLHSFKNVVLLQDYHPLCVAFGALTQAVPLNQRETSIQARVPGGVAPVSRPTIATVFAQLNVDLDVALCPLNHVTRENSTAVIVKPVVLEVNAVLQKAVVAVEALVALSAEDSCKDKDGALLTIDVAVKIVVDVVLAVVVALKAVLVVCVDLKAVIAILAVVLNTLLSLLRAVIKICVQVYGQEFLVRIQAFLSVGICAYVFAAVNVAIAL